MTPESTQQFDIIDGYNQRLTAVFRAAGAELVAPSIIQPAGLFLDVIGESLRGRTYVFTDPEGHELCLRPDLTVPTCRIYLDRDPTGTSAQRFCYSGPIFRFQPQDAPKANAREMRQAGYESFGAPDRAATDADVLITTIAALRDAGLRDFDLRMGDLGLLHAILDAQAMPQRWRQRLAHQFWRRDAFHSELKRLVSWPAASAEGIDPDLLARLDPDKPDEAEAHVAEYLTQHNIDVFGTRELSEIAAGLLDAAADTRSGPLPKAHADLIEGYVAITGTPAAAIDALERLAISHRCDIGAAIGVYRARLKLLAAAGIDLDRARFSGEFGRQFEYYTGFVFELVSPVLGSKSPVAGGGRYDSLLTAVGAPNPVPAVGAAIYTERLRAAIDGSTR
jgi:ATP phosphoribosyltransferase regulatory subunit